MYCLCVILLVSPSVEAGHSDGTAISKSWKMQTVSLPVEGTCVPVVITGIYSPVRFWVQLLPSKTNPAGVYVCACAYVRCMHASIPVLIKYV